MARAQRIALQSMLFALLALGLTALNLQADPLAIVASTKGQVDIMPAAGGALQRATFGRSLERGDKVQVGSDGAATVVFNDGNVIELSAGSAITIGGRMTDNPQVGPGAALPDEVFAQVSKYVTGGSRQKGLVALSAMRSSTDENGAILISPRESDVMTDRPYFRWRAVAGATRYKVSVSGDDGDIWAHETAETEAVLPDDVDALIGDADYIWHVQALGDNGRLRDEETFFHVLDDERRVVVVKHLAHIDESTGGDGSAASHFLSGSYLYSRGIYGDAAEHFEALSLISPDSPTPHEALGNVYRAVGLMDLAAAEFERALTLTREH
jgi:hypothetical protein